MATAANRRIPLRCLHALARQRLSDGELLRRYLAGGDEEAFAEIVRRQGPLVLRACRHVLGETTAAEDALQATFLLLARKGRSLTATGSLAGWLHAAAVRVAWGARRAAGRRRRRESAAGERAGARPPSEELMWREVRERLDAELAALPEKYRLPLVLCYLQELSYEEAARWAGCSTGALRGRLERGKRILRARLARYGLPVAAPILVLGQPPAVSAALCQATVATVRAALSGGAVPAAVAALAGSAFSLKARVMSLAGVVLTAFGLAWASQSASSVAPKPADPPQAPAEARPAAPPGRGTDARGDPLPPGAVARFGTRRFQVPMYPLPLSVRGGNAYLFYHPGTGERGRAELRWLDAATGKRLDAWPIPLGPQYDADTGKPTHAVPEVSLPLAGLSPDGRWAVFTDPRVMFSGLRARGEKRDRSVNLYVYDLTARKKVKHLRGPHDKWEGPPSVAYLSADGRWLAYGVRKARLWDVTAGKQVWESEDPEKGQGFGVLGFTAGGKHLVLCGSNDYALMAVDTARARVVRTIATNIFNRGCGTLLSPDGVVLIGLSNPWDTAAWDVLAGKQLPPLGQQGERFNAWAFSPDGKTLVRAPTFGGKPVLVLDWPSRKVRRRLDVGRRRVAYLSISADNRTLNVLFDHEHTLHRYDLATGRPLPVPGETHRGQVVGVAVAPDGSILSLGTDRVLREWDLTSGRQTREVTLDFAPAETPFALSRDGKLLAAADYYQSEAVILDRGGKVVRRIDTTNQRIDQVVLSPSGRFLVGGGHQAKTVRVWETATGKTVAEFAAAKGVWWSRTVDFGFSPDERYFVATADGRVRFWEVSGWRPRGELPGYFSGIAFSPDSRMLACGNARETDVWELATRKLRVKVGSKADWNRAQRFSPDGRLLALLTSAEVVEVWDVVSGRQVAAFRGHDRPITAFAFTNDGRHLITASDDCTLLAWDLAGAGAAARAGQKAPLR